jgi:integrase
VALFKRGHKWSSYVWVDGIRYVKATGTSNRRLAEKIDHDFKDELQRRRLGMQAPRPEMTFGELAARFLAEGSPRPHHLDRLKMLLPFFSDIQIGRIGKAIVREYRAERHALKQVSEATVNRDFGVLRHLLYWAVDEGLLAANPLARMSLVRERRIPRKVMSVAEEASLLDAAARHLRNLIIAAVDTGMRRGELLAERWEHIDFDRELLFVTRSKTAGGEGREIPLTRRLHDLLTANRQSTGLVFTLNGKPLRNIKTAWKSAIRRAGIRYVRFHDLRHCFNSRLLEAGVMQEVRKALMGHSSGEDVHSIYTHVELPMKREAIRKLEAWHAAQLKKVEEGGNNDSTKGSGVGIAEVRSNTSRNAKAVEEEIPGGSRA